MRVMTKATKSPPRKPCGEPRSTDEKENPRGGTLSSDNIPTRKRERRRSAGTEEKRAHARFVLDSLSLKLSATKQRLCRH